MCANNDKKNEALQKLQQILEEAINVGADSIELEYVDDGLEVCYIFGGTGVDRFTLFRILYGSI
jgi:hypothetical protein